MMVVMDAPEITKLPHETVAGERRVRTGVLSDADLARFAEQGYVVVPDAVPAENLRAMEELIWRFLDADEDDPASWYRIAPREATGEAAPISRAGMVEVYQQQALWDNRQYPRVYQAFADIWQTEHLWVTLDRANMKPPVHSDHPEWQHGGFIHWDLDTMQKPVPCGVQGVLYLSDTAADQGGFQCVPGFPRRFVEWVRTQPTDRDPRYPDLDGLDVRSIPGRAGDLLIWNSLLPHGNGENTSDRPRLAQYISMFPAARGTEQERLGRIAAWREQRSASGWPGDSRNWEQRHGQCAKLNSLGRRLLGLDAWD